MNSLGSLSGFEVDPTQTEPTGMRYATGPAPAAPPLVGAAATQALIEEQKRTPPGRPRTPDPETMATIATRVEAYLKELRKPKALPADRMSEIDSELRSIGPALFGEIRMSCDTLRRERQIQILDAAK
jgi:hypothetical protein